MTAYLEELCKANGQGIRHDCSLAGCSHAKERDPQSDGKNQNRLNNLELI